MAIGITTPSRSTTKSGRSRARAWSRTRARWWGRKSTMATDDSTIGPEDPRYRAVLDKQFNKRFRAKPDYVCLAGSAAQVVSAVERAVSEGRRLVVTSGGHCLEGFV